jgi:hypothetical protein
VRWRTKDEKREAVDELHESNGPPTIILPGSHLPSVHLEFRTGPRQDNSNTAEFNINQSTLPRDTTGVADVNIISSSLLTTRQSTIFGCTIPLSIQFILCHSQGFVAKRFSATDVTRVDGVSGAGV